MVWKIGDGLVLGMVWKIGDGLVPGMDEHDMLLGVGPMLGTARECAQGAMVEARRQWRRGRSPCMTA